MNLIPPLPPGAKACAVIENGAVVNMIVATADDPAPPGTIMVYDPPKHVTYGTKFDGTKFEDPPPPVDLSTIRVPE